MTVVVTGAVPGLTRNQGNEAVEELGGKFSSFVSARTDFVVVGDGAGSKTTKAADLGLPILDADKFAQLLAAHRAGDHDTAAAILDTVTAATTAWPVSAANAATTCHAAVARRRRTTWPSPQPEPPWWPRPEPWRRGRSFEEVVAALCLRVTRPSTPLAGNPDSTAQIRPQRRL